MKPMKATKSVVISAVSKWLFVGLLVAGLSVLASAQEPGPPPPPPGGPQMMGMEGPGGMGGAFFHEEVGLDSHKVVTGAPMTATVSVTHDQTLSDGNTIHTDNQSTEYRDSQGRVRREVPFKLSTPATGTTEGTMIVIMDPVAGKRYVLNPQKKTAHEMPLHPPKPRGVDTVGAAPLTKPGEENVTTESLGSKTILGLPATGTRVTRTIPAGQIGNTKPISVVTERWVSTDLQIPLSMTHSDPMMGTMTSTVTSVTRGEPDASLFQVSSDYKIENGKPGDMMYMTARP
jgi:hypothetical protein